MTSTKSTIPGYSNLQLLHSSQRTIVYRGLQNESKQPVVIKLLKSEYPTFNELVNFRNQYVIAKNIDVPGVVKPLALENYGLGFALVMPDFGGISLSDYIAKQSLSLSEFLRVAIALCRILEGLYRHRVIHKDIKPANILIHPETLEVKLFDFSIASLLPKETQVLQNPGILEGTLAYMSPEQTGRMNRGIDYRSDFYSLGVTFYQILTGQLPFLSSDPMELVHCHIARTPTPGHEVKPDIPQVLSSMVMKLMAKTAENRYQTARGLRHDLEKCYSQWVETGGITPFELATRDISESFIIPEKLYGREAEVETLLAAFDRVANPPQPPLRKGGQVEMMLVAGFSGIGKTAVVNEVHKPIVRQRGYFIKGKFDQFQRNIPLSAFVQAFRDLMGQLLCESDAQLAAWKSKILEALGQNGQVIIDVIPELEHIIGQQPTLRELSGSAAQNRFNMLFEKFIAVFTTPDHPLTIFLDDLQWADSASLNLLKLMMGSAQMGYLLLLGAYRDNEVFPAHPLMLTLDEIGKTRATIDRITLAPLSQVDLNQLIADTLSCTLELALPLTDLLYQKTKGNPFFATQFLKGLHADGAIAFNSDVGYWQCDMTRVRELALTDDVVEFMAGQLQKLPTPTQSVLKLAACLGNQFDLTTLAVVCEQSLPEVATALWRALQEGLVLPLGEMYKFFQGVSDDERVQSEEVSVGYKFLHDQVQQAAYSLISETDRSATHLRIGRLLLSSNYGEENQNFFTIVNQFNYGLEIIEDRSEKNQIATLNLLAAQKAKASTAYKSAVNYANTALQLLESDSWQANYELTLSIYTEAVEIEYLNTNFSRSEELAKKILKNAQKLLDRVKAYELQIQSYVAQLRLEDVMETGLKVLQELGVNLSEFNRDTRGYFQDIETKLKAENKQLQDLANLPEMSDPYKLAAIKILWSVTSTAYIGNPALMPQLLSATIDLCMNYGNPPIAASVYVNFGVCLVMAKEIETGYRFGQLGLTLLSKVGIGAIQPTVLQLFNAFVRHWKDSIKETIEPLFTAMTIGLEIGNFEYGSYACICYHHHSFWAGINLQYIADKCQQYILVMANFKQEYAVYFLKMTQQMLLTLLGKTESKNLLIGTNFDEGELFPLWEETNNLMTLFFGYVFKTIMTYLFSNYAEAIVNAQTAEKYKGVGGAMMVTGEHNFYYSLSLIAHYYLVNESVQKQYLETVIANQKDLQFWAENAETNYQHKYQLVAAEKNRIMEKKLEALELYDRAIAGAKENGYVQEEALANELAAKFYLDWGKEKIARTYMIDAYYCYARWGAKAKVEDLEQRYPLLLAPILNQETTVTPNAAIATMSMGTITSSTTSASVLLDLYSALKASQAISGEIKLEELLVKLMQVIIENAGASKAALLLPKGDGLAIEAIASYDADSCAISVTSVAQSKSVAESEEIPQLVINTIWHTHETLVLNDVPADRRFAGDSYLHRCQPKSLLCTPLFNQGKLIAILYLENQLVTGAFTSSRISILNLLTVQAAISLENARLYQQSLDYAQQLEQAQLQLVQSEKMATVGQLAAGVAHEINNPVSFISGNLHHAREYTQDLIELVELYQKHYPQPVPEIAEKISRVELDYLIEDLPQLIDSMHEGTDRITEISKSMRTFSRADTVAKVAFNLHEGLDSTLLILKHRLKANQNRPAIQVVKNYGDLPDIPCYPGQLNQVFMNIIANAIDAFDEGNQGKTFAEISSHPNQITITTEIGSTIEGVTVRIKDNGTGMPESVKEKIFNNLFTTKPVGKGTGLGLAISRQIVEEKHGGKLTCTSQVGQGTSFAIALPLDNY